MHKYSDECQGLYRQVFLMRILIYDTHFRLL